MKVDKMTETSLDLKARYQSVMREIEGACLKAGRDPKTVKLMLVTKTVSVDRIKMAIDLGHTLFGENKVQELNAKRIGLSETSANFHFIGHLQSNKVKKCLELTNFIHSVDRLSLASELNKNLEVLKRDLEILIQVNTSNEESKFGVHPDKLSDLVREVAKFPRLKIKGLMTLAKFSKDESEIRPCFKLLKNLSEQIRAEAISGVEMKELSMGMSSDYLLAVEEGATIVRVGQAIFGPRNTSDSYYWPETIKPGET